MNNLFVTNTWDLCFGVEQFPRNYSFFTHTPHFVTIDIEVQCTRNRIEKLMDKDSNGRNASKFLYDQEREWDGQSLWIFWWARGQRHFFNGFDDLNQFFQSSRLPIKCKAINCLENSGFGFIPVSDQAITINVND